MTYGIGRPNTYVYMYDAGSQQTIVPALRT